MNKKFIISKIIIFIFSAANLFAQNQSVDLKKIWQNIKNSDSVRFKALADYYALNNQAQPDSALKALDDYYQLAKEKNNTEELYNVANDRGGIYRLTGKFDSSFKYYNIAENLAEELNDPVLKATILGNKGNVYANTKDYIKALQHFTQALKIFSRLQDRKGESNMLSSIGNVYLYIQNFDLAIEYYEKALAIAENTDVPQRRKAVIYINIAWTNYELKKYENSIKKYRKALEILEITNDKFFLIEAYSTLAKIHIELDEIEKAADYAEKNYILSKELKRPDFIADGRIILALLEFKKGNIEVAREQGESILQGLDENYSNNIKLNLYDLLYKIYEAKKNSKKSLEMYQMMSAYKDSIQLERNKISLIREVVKNEFDNVMSENEQKIKREKAELESKQQQKIYITISMSIILILLIVYYFNKNLKANRTKRDELLQEIEKLKNKELNNLVVNPNEFQLVREKIEKSIDRKLNDTDWNVLNILLKEPDISNKEIAEKAFMSVDGIGSSLRRMYAYFDIKESKYKKVSLIMEAIKVSSE